MTNRAASRSDLWAKAWKALASDRLLLFWLGLLALAALAAFWFPQAPRSAYQQDGGAESWLALVRPQLGRPADTWFALGFLSIARSAWLRLFLAGTALTLLLRAFDAAQRLTGFTNITRPAATHQLITPTEAAAALGIVGSQLERKLRYKIMDEPDHRLVAYRPLAQIGSLGVMLGGLIIIAGWLWTETTGWEVAELRLTEDMPAAIAPSNQTLSLDLFEVQWGSDDAPTTAWAKLVLQDDNAIATGQVDLSKAWHWQGITFRLTAVGPAIQVEGQGADGESLLLQTAAHRPPAKAITLLLPPEGGPRSFAAPDEGVVVQMETESAGDSPQIQLRIYQGQKGELVRDQVIDQEASIALENSNLTFNVIPYAQINASYTPGRSPLIAGVAVVLASALFSLGYPSRQLEVTALAQEENTELTFAAGRQGDLAWLIDLASCLDSKKVRDSDGNEK